MQKLLSMNQPNALSVSSSLGLSFSIPPGISHSTWVFYSGATLSIANYSSLFLSIFSPPSSATVMAANGTSMSLADIPLRLSDVYCIPQLPLNLISISQLWDIGYRVHFSSTSCVAVSSYEEADWDRSWRCCMFLMLPHLILICLLFI